jgi:hypothetical protein
MQPFLLVALLYTVTAIPDWLVTTFDQEVEFVQLDDNTYQLANGLISRTFTLLPDFGTVNFYSYSADQSLQRAIYPEAMVTIDGLIF